jgi:tetratricopeptide (TPR) repeat protein
MKFPGSSMDRANLIRTILFLLTVGLLGPVSSATAELENQLEPEYSLAVLDYNARDFDSAIKMLNELQKKAPAAVEILELKAITFKAMKNDKEAANVYRDLVQLKTKEGKDKKEIAPYAFELGVIRYNEKNLKQAEQYLNFSAKNGFNVEVSHFYLGLVEVQTEQWAKAEIDFNETLKSDLDELKPASHYYLSQVYFKLGYPSDGFGHLISAKQSAQKYIDRQDVQPESKKMAEQVRDAAAATLAPFDKAQKFGTFSFMIGYDSNVLLVPSGSANSTSASGKSTLKSMVSAGYGYASSPLSAVQYVPSVRVNLNKNFNGASSTGEFADTTFSLYLTKDALAPVSWGLKTEGTFVFQNQTDANSAKKYHLYDDSIEFEPYVKWDASKRWTYGLELGDRLIKYAGEDTVDPTLRRSGHAVVGRISAQNKAARRYFNPTYAIRFELNSTDGTEYANNLYGAQIINVMKLGQVDFSQVLEIDHTGYGQSSTARKDTLYLFSLLASRKIGPRWAALASGDYSSNASNDSSTYGYNRFTLNAGVGYNF